MLAPLGLNSPMLLLIPRGPPWTILSVSVAHMGGVAWPLPTASARDLLAVCTLIEQWTHMVTKAASADPENAFSLAPSQMAAHSSILVWRSTRKEEPGGLQSMGSQTVRHH